jgi:hypothetical protein
MPLFDVDGDVAAALALVGLKESLESTGEVRLRALLERACEEIQARIAQGIRLPASPAGERAALKRTRSEPVPVKAAARQRRTAGAQ